jgi:hypothetical protein
MHGQPPLFNLFVGSIYKFIPEYFDLFFEIVFKFCTLITSIYIFKTLLFLKVNKRISFFSSLIFQILPVVILYENWLFYNYFIVFFLVFIGYFLLKNSFKSFLYIFISLFIICLWISTFHFSFFLLMALYYFYVFKLGKRKIMISISFFVLILSWYAKNKILFDSFSSSTWMGMGLEKFIWPHRSDIGWVGIFEPIDKYKPYLKEDNRYPNIEILHKETKKNGGRNLNHIQYLQVSESSKKDFIDFFKESWDRYFIISSWGFFKFMNPSSNYPFVSGNYLKIYHYAKWINIDIDKILKNPYEYNRSKKQASFLIFMNIFISINLFFLTKNNRFNIFLGYYFITFFFVCSTTTFLELGENNRFRVMLLGIFFIAMVISINNVIVFLKNRLKYNNLKN